MNWVDLVCNLDMLMILIISVMALITIIVEYMHFT